MTGFEYKVVPAPLRGLKAPGVKGTPARFANALQTLMNEFGADGWEYQRTDTLPVQERQGLTGKTTTFQNMLVFRRALEATAEDTPHVAALIEDQTDAIEDVEDATPDMDETPEDDTTTAKDIADDVSDGPAPLAAQKRVSETLNAPFAFPWNRRADSTSKTDGDTKDGEPHAPAK